MKKISNVSISIILALTLCMLCISCGGNKEDKDIWETAIYTEDTTVGSGSKSVIVQVVAEEKSVTFTVNTDAETVGGALSENELIAGENGPYGLYVKEVNGIIADYNVNQSYWSFYKDGEYMQTGVDKTEFSDGEHYELVYTK